MNSTLGYIAIIITILVWGTWLIFSRKSAGKLNNPFLENFLITLGALVFNILVFIGYYIYSGEISFEWKYFLYPFVSGILWAFAGLFAFISISKIGVGKALSIWAPSGMIVSFLWGVLYYGEFLSSLLYAVLSVVTIIIGVSLVIKSRNTDEDSKLVFTGVLFAIAASLVWGGTYLVPIKELSSEISAFYTLLPLSIGMLFGSLGIYGMKQKWKGLSVQNIKIGFPIIASGFMWGVGNFFAIIAVLNIGIGKAYPLAELCGVVNALFAVFFLKEITEQKKVRLFLLGTAVSFIGAIWLSILKI